MGFDEQQEGEDCAHQSGRGPLRSLDLEAAAPEGNASEGVERPGQLQLGGPHGEVALQPHRPVVGAWPPLREEQHSGFREAGRTVSPLEESSDRPGAFASFEGRNQGAGAMLGTGQNFLQPIEASFGGGAFQEYAGPGLRGETRGAPSRASEGAPRSSPPLQPQALPASAAPLMPPLHALDPRSLAGSTWSRSETSRWAAPNVAGLLNASLAPAPPPVRPRAEPAMRAVTAAAVLPVPDDLAARASGAWHASLGFQGLPGGTQGFAVSTADMTSLALGMLPPSAAEVLERKPEGPGEKPRADAPGWLSLDLQGEGQEKPARVCTPPLAKPPAQRLFPLAPQGNSAERRSGDAEASAWYEQFKANIPIIASQGEHVPTSTWALVQASGLKPPSPVLPSPLKPAAQLHAPPGSRPRERERKREADFLSRMEQKEGGGVQEEPAVPPATQAAGLLFGGTYNAVVEAARSKALKEIKDIALPPLLTDPPSTRPLFSVPSKPALVVPPSALSTFLSTGQSTHEVRMDPLKPLDLSDTPPLRGSPPASLSLKGWTGRSANPSLDISSPGGGSKKRSREGSQSGDETRTLDVTKKKQRGKPSESQQEPSTRLTLELGSSEERGGSGDFAETRAAHTPRLPSPKQRMPPGMTPVSVLGESIGSAAASTAYAAYLDSVKAGMSLSNVGNPVRAGTPTGSSSGSAAVTGGRNVSLLWRGSSDETWNSTTGGAEGEPPQRTEAANRAMPPLPGSLGFLRSQGGGEPAGREPPHSSAQSIAPSSGTEGGVARSSMASILGGYKAKLPGWPDKPMPADEYLTALQSSHFRLNAEVQEPRTSEAER